MVCQMESRRVENTLSAMNRYIVLVVIKSEKIIGDRIGLSHSIDSFRTMFINKLFDYRTRAKRQELYWGVFMFQIITYALNPIFVLFLMKIFLI